MNQLKKENIEKIEDVFFAFLSSERIFYAQPMAKSQKKGG